MSVDIETVVFPGFDGGAEWGGSAFDPESGLLYVNAKDVPWSWHLAEDRGGNSGRRIYLRSRANCHGKTLAGAPPALPSLVAIGSKLKRSEVETVIRRGGGRMLGFQSLNAADVSGLADYLIGLGSKELL